MGMLEMTILRLGLGFHMGHKLEAVSHAAGVNITWIRNFRSKISLSRFVAAVMSSGLTERSGFTVERSHSEYTSSSYLTVPADLGFSPRGPVYA